MAARYWVGTGGNWNSTSNWAATSGGSPGASVPVNLDDVYFDNNSGACTVNVNTANLKTLDFTNYSNTITISGTNTINLSPASGIVTLIFSAAMTISTTTGVLSIGASANVTSNGKTWPGNATFGGNPSINFNDNFIITGNLNISSGTVRVFSTPLTTVTLTVNGNLTIQNTTTLFTAPSGSGNPITVVLGGTGTMSSVGTGTFSGNYTINTSGTITLGSIRWSPNTSSGAASVFKYTAGTVNSGTSTFTVVSINNGRLDLNGSTSGGASTTSSTGVNLYNFTVGINASTNIVYLRSPLYVANTFTADSTVGTTVTFIGTDSGSVNPNIYVNGSANINKTLLGTSSDLYMVGTGTLTTVGSNRLNTNLIINSVGTVTLSSTVNLGDTTSSRSMTYTAGTIDSVTNTSTVNITTSTSSPFVINNFGGSSSSYLYNVTFATGGATYQINTNSLVATNTITVIGTTSLTTTFTSSGSNGFTCRNFTTTTPGSIIILKSGATYIVGEGGVGTLTMTGTGVGTSQDIHLRASTSGSRAIFTLRAGSNVSVSYVNPTDIDSSNGRSIKTYFGIIVNTLNWIRTPITVAFTWVE